ncbi:MAG: efflux RND transporter periplasmic adaptor subunit [Methyloligellaceae bacterium]
MKSGLSFWLQLIVFLLLLGASGALWFGKEDVTEVLAGITRPDGQRERAARPRGQRKVPVVVRRVGRSNNDVTIEAIATARAKRFVTLNPEAAGEILHFGVQAGDRVKRGHVILRLDSRVTELAVEVAKVRLVEAERLLTRAARLHSKNVNSQAKVDDARTVMQRARLELEQAQDALSRRTMRAPFDGFVGIPKAETGDRVTTASTIITMDDRSELVVEIDVPEQYLSRLKMAQKITARTPSFGERRFQGTVDKIDSRIDPTSRAVTIRAHLPNHDDELRPGMSFAVELSIPGQPFPTVHELALQWRNGESYVWRVNDGTVEKVTVRTVRRRNSVILVDGDVKQGDLVVFEGVQRLRPGRPVSYVEPKPGANG